MPTLRTKTPGYPRYCATLVKSMYLRNNYALNVMGLSPVAYWPLTETVGANAADLSGNNLTATYNTVTLANAAGPGASMGNAPYFDGLTSFVQLPAAGLNAKFDPTKGTMCAWFYLNELWSVSATRRMFIIGADGNNRIYSYKAATYPKAIVDAGGVAYGNDGAAALTPTGWHHSLITWDKVANQALWLLDGALVGSAMSWDGNWVGALTDSWTMLGASSGASFWKGWLAHAAFWNRVLTAPERLVAATAV